MSALVASCDALETPRRYWPEVQAIGEKRKEKKERQKDKKKTKKTKMSRKEGRL
jgi:hypothetical protein